MNVACGTVARFTVHYFWSPVREDQHTLCPALAQMRWQDLFCPQYGIVLDAGSSHTNLYVYEWPAEKENDTGVVQQVEVCKVEGKRRKGSSERGMGWRRDEVAKGWGRRNLEEGANSDRYLWALMYLHCFQLRTACAWPSWEESWVHFPFVWGCTELNAFWKELHPGVHLITKFNFCMCLWWSGAKHQQVGRAGFYLILKASAQAGLAWQGCSTYACHRLLLAILNCCVNSNFMI